jgi:uncharacterized membrane protein YedE/YeeE
VETQSYTFISPLGDLARLTHAPTDTSLISFGVAAMLGVVLGSFLHAWASRQFRLEWFASGADFFRHSGGAILMGIGGVLAMGCTIGQGVTGISTLALGSFVSVAGMMAGAALTMKFLYWRLMQED